MTSKELIEFFRLNVRFPEKTIERMRKKGLQAVQVSKHVLFKLDDVLDFLKKEQQRNPR